MNSREADFVRVWDDGKVLGEGGGWGGEELPKKKTEILFVSLL